ncbi:DUF421 domain-containing protein [Ammoniphilus sp. CFH 90114]|uniref:DUF421 domain-containing protein n=1 Tax=Ammoniphilus sp. CFH 90114 TaxID=2493665 RepID=UPI00100F9D20|nr:YetF domain-containing protein [Ammoniphilus sp. CFH 90114]RXT07114.1 DUF421 domain-containing protein [Ammoniphilus sp. CFH 90114]
MSIHYLWESIILLFVSIILLRIAGKKSVAQMTPVETIVILAIGTTMGHAIKENKLWQVIMVLAVFVFTLIIIQRVQLTFNKFEHYLVGQATIVIENGAIVEHSLKKLRMTKEQLKMRIRQKGISYVSDIRIGTIEANGEFGFELMPHARPVTNEQLNKMLGKEDKNLTMKSGNIFDEIREK